MPIKIDSSFFGLSPSSCFDCDIDDISVDAEEFSSICSGPCEDIWKKFDDFLLTPPQSPPIAFELVSDLVEHNSTADLGLNVLGDTLHNIDVLHDCMWSGQCIEDNNNGVSVGGASASGFSCRSNYQRPDTPMMLGTSPISSSISCSLNEILSPCGSDDIDDDLDDKDDMTSGSQSSAMSSSSSCSASDSLINDHSYGSGISQQSNATSSYRMQSLIYPPKSKCHRVHTRSKSGVRCPKNNSDFTIKASPNVSTVKFVKGAGNGHCVVKILKDKNLPQSTIMKIAESARKHCKVSIRRKSGNVQEDRIIVHKQPSLQTSSKHEKVKHQMHEDTSEEMTRSPSTKETTKHPLRRREHNDSERKRRDHLRNAFHTLRDEIPKLKCADKRPPRIQILHEATSYVHQLIEKQRYLERTKKAEIEKREELLKRLSQLQFQQ